MTVQIDIKHAFNANHKALTTRTISSDLNECEVGAFACAENEDCQDTVGGYDCVCSAGWNRTEEGSSCTGRN